MSLAEIVVCKEDEGGFYHEMYLFEGYIEVFADKDGFEATEEESFYIKFFNEHNKLIRKTKHRDIKIAPAISIHRGYSIGDEDIAGEVLEELNAFFILVEDFAYLIINPPSDRRIYYGWRYAYNLEDS